MNTEKIKEAIDDEGRLRVHLVPMPSGDDPWRTQGDYRSEQERAEKLHSAQIKVLEKLSKHSWYQTTGIIISILVLALSFLSFMFSSLNLDGSQYQYIDRAHHGVGTYVLRIEKDTGSMCYIVQDTTAKAHAKQLLTIAECK